MSGDSLFIASPSPTTHVQNMKASRQTGERIVTWGEARSVGASALGI